MKLRRKYKLLAFFNILEKWRDRKNYGKEKVNKEQRVNREYFIPAQESEYHPYSLY